MSELTHPTIQGTCEAPPLPRLLVNLLQEHADAHLQMAGSLRSPACGLARP